MSDYVFLSYSSQHLLSVYRLYYNRPSLQAHSPCLTFTLHLHSPRTNPLFCTIIGAGKERKMNQNYLKQKKILLVDDEQELLDMVVSILKEDGYTHIATAKTAAEGAKSAQKNPPDLAVLDVMLPDGSGFELLKRLKETRDYPVLFLSARGEDEDRLQGLGLGADDYIVKPFLPQELLYRISAILRRSYKEETALLSLADCQIDFERAEVLRGEKKLPLTAKEFALLSALAQNAGKIVTIDALCEAAWGDNPYGYENSLMAHIRRIREKIEENPSKPRSLLTVKGLGYKLITED